MNLDMAIGIEDALDCMGHGMNAEQFIACVKPCARKINAEYWNQAVSLIAEKGTRTKAMNHVMREIDRARDEFFPL